MNIELTPEDAQKLINSQRSEINTLKAKLLKVAKNATAMVETKAMLPEEFLKAATDLCGRYWGESINEEFLEEMRELYEAQLREGHKRPKLSLFDTPFLFAILGDTPYKMSNLKYELREILEAAGAEVPKWL